MIFSQASTATHNLLTLVSSHCKKRRISLVPQCFLHLHRIIKLPGTPLPAPCKGHPPAKCRPGSSGFGAAWSRFSAYAQSTVGPGLYPIPLFCRSVILLLLCTLRSSILPQRLQHPVCDCLRDRPEPLVKRAHRLQLYSGTLLPQAPPAFYSFLK